jgi:hypothetical protein
LILLTKAVKGAILTIISSLAIMHNLKTYYSSNVGGLNLLTFEKVKPWYEFQIMHLQNPILAT